MQPPLAHFESSSSGSGSSSSDGSAYGGFGPAILGVTWAEAGLTTIIVGLRAFTALRVLASSGWDLVWVVLAWITTLIAQIFLTLAVAFGSGNHVTSIPSPGDLRRAVQWSWLGQYLLLVGAVLGKLAVVALLLRIQVPGHKRKTWIMLAVWTAFALLSVVQVVFVILQCRPVRKLWDRDVPGTCEGRVRAERTGFATGSLGAFADVVLAIYPYFVFWELDLSWRKKLGLSLLMSGGLLAAIVTAMKTYYIQRAPKTDDPTYSLSPLIICAYTEVWVIILLGSVPQLRVLFMAKRTSLSRSRRSSSTTPSLSEQPATKDAYSLPELEQEGYSEYHEEARGQAGRKCFGQGQTRDLAERVEEEHESERNRGGMR